MAYLDLSHAFVSAPSAASQPLQPALRRPSGFSGLEWSVIALAERDGLSSLENPGRVTRALGSLFGLGAVSRLADPKLEALRRMAVHAWHRSYQLPVSEIARFVEAGFTTDQAETLLASVSRQRADQRSRIAA